MESGERNPARHKLRRGRTESGMAGSGMPWMWDAIGAAVGYIGGSWASLPCRGMSTGCRWGCTEYVCICAWSDKITVRLSFPETSIRMTKNKQKRYGGTRHSGPVISQPVTGLGLGLSKDSLKRDHRPDHRSAILLRP